LLEIALLSALVVPCAFAGGKSKTIRICDNNGCRDQAPDYVAPDPNAGLKAARQDQDVYRGEPREQLISDYENGSPAAAYKLGLIALYGIGNTPKNEVEAAKYFDYAAAKGHVWAEFRLAGLLSNSRAVPRDDRRALELLFAAAKAGQPQCANNIGLKFLSGDGLPRDSQEALMWLSIAAEAGVPEAQFNLGALYLRGDTGSRDLYLGYKWLMKASKLGNPDAQRALGRIYMTGLDTIAQDLNKAVDLLQPLADRGDKDAKAWLSQLQKSQEAEEEAAEKARERSNETFKFLAGVAFSTIFAPPPVYVVY